MSPLTQKVGHRGCWLIVGGLMWVFFGLGLTLEAEARVPGAFHQWLPLWLRVALWCGTGAVAVAVGLRGKGGNDALGHVALWLMPAERLLSFLGSWFAWVAAEILSWIGMPVGQVGYERAWYPALVWAVILTMLRLVAAWPNPSPRPPMPSLEEVRRDG